MTSDSTNHDKQPPLPHEGHRDANIAYHIKWPYSPRAFLWEDRPSKRSKTKPCGINFVPLATELRLWLLQQGQVSYYIHAPKGRGPATLTNPYAESGSVLSLMYADVINDTYTFSNSNAYMGDIDAEMRRARYYSEIALLNARICEACIKQLLYCTAIPRKDYKGTSLRGLLVQECRHCKDSTASHNISLLGSLAHRFHLCREVEGCLGIHLNMANKRRNTQASHATFTGFAPGPVADVRTRLQKEVTDLGEELVHMLKHIGRIEDEMWAELSHALIVGMDDPWWKPI